MKAPLVIVLLMFTACSGDTPPLVASDVILKRPLPGTQMSSGYLTLTNNTSQAITITRVESPQYASVSLHESVVEDGMARMYELGELTLLANSSAVFEPGGKHLMLMRPIEDVDVVTLEFYAGMAVVLSVEAAVTD